MNKQKIDLMSFNPDDLKPSGFIDERQIEKIKHKVTVLYKYAFELKKISGDMPELPPVFINEISNYESSLVGFIQQIEEVANKPPEVVARSKNLIYKNFENFYSKSLGFAPDNQQNGRSMLEVYCLVLAYFSNNQNNSEIKAQKTEINSLLGTSKEILSELKEDSESASIILNELQKKASKSTVSDYASVFEASANNHMKHSKNWLIAGIMMSVIFIVYIFTDAVYRFFPTEIIDPNTNELIRYDLTNLASKILVIAILVFFISFSFKQYNVNRHLQTLNRHRQHALNSYILFSQSISGDDVSSRNALMIQVARAIYEHNQSTGFLSEKGQQINSGILELTKIIGDSKPT